MSVVFLYVLLFEFISFSDISFSSLVQGIVIED